MDGVKKVFSSVLLILLWSFTVNALQCLECKDMPRPEDCRTVTTCSGSSQCYVDQVVTTGGVVLYNFGCTSQCSSSSKRSLALNILNKRQDTVSKTDIVTCRHCCRDEFCNIDGCGPTAVRQPQRPPLCFSCDSQSDPHSCRDVTLCDPNHQCKALGRVAILNGGPCYTCCQDDFCNSNCNQHTSTQVPAASTAAVTKSILTNSVPTTVTIVPPTKHITTSILPTVTTIFPTKQTQSQETTTSISTSINPATVSGSTFLPTQSSAATSSTTYKLATSNSTVSSYSPTTTYSIDSTTPFSATTNPHKKRTSTTPEMTTSESIRYSSVIHSTTAKNVLSSAVSLFSNVMSTSATPPETSTNSTNSKTVQTTITPYTRGGCMNRTFDICFVIDSSGSLGQDGFDKELQLVTQLVKSVAMETNTATHFCVVVFSTKAHTYIKLMVAGSNVDQTINDIGTIPYTRNGETNTHHGLQQALHQMNHTRHGAEKEIILITDGISNKPLKTQHMSELIKSHGIDVYAIGVGLQTNSSELAQIVTDKANLFEVPDLDHLQNAHIDVIQALCSNENVDVTTIATHKPKTTSRLSNTSLNLTDASVSTTPLPQTGSIQGHSASNRGTTYTTAFALLSTTDAETTVTISTRKLTNGTTFVPTTEMKTNHTQAYAIPTNASKTRVSITNVSSYKTSTVRSPTNTKLNQTKSYISTTSWNNVSVTDIPSYKTSTSRSPTNTKLNQTKGNLSTTSWNNVSVTDIPSYKTSTTRSPTNTKLNQTKSYLSTTSWNNVSATDIPSYKTSTTRSPTNTKLNQTKGYLSTTSWNNVSVTDIPSYKTSTTRSPTYTKLNQTKGYLSTTSWNNVSVTDIPSYKTSTTISPTNTKLNQTKGYLSTKSWNNVSVTDISSYKTSTTRSPTTTAFNRMNTSLPTTSWINTYNSSVTASTPFVLFSTAGKETTVNATNLITGISLDPKTEVQTIRTPTVTSGEKQPYTSPPNPIMCATCSGPDFLCEKLYSMQQCNPPNNYCVNKLRNHKDGSRLVTRGCAEFETCYRDWFLGSSDSDKCRKFDQNNILTLAFDCTYCCVNDNCNVPIRPTDASLYRDL